MKIPPVIKGLVRARQWLIASVLLHRVSHH
jgi:hypothetical protein